MASRRLEHHEIEALLHGSPADRRWLLDYWNEVVGRLPPELEHRRPCLLGPPEAFPDEPAPASYFRHWADHAPDRMGPRSIAVARRLAASCAGWARRPSAAEFYDAIRSGEVDARQRCLISTWAEEASRLDLLDAWGEHVYTIRQLVAAFHKVDGLRTFTSFRWLNNMATAPEADGIPLWNC